MKNSKLRRFLVLFALVIIIQNGTIIVQNTGNGAETGTGVAPCSDFPGHDDSYD
jgi:hypothetical protein